MTKEIGNDTNSDILWWHLNIDQDQVLKMNLKYSEKIDTMVDADNI